MASAFTSNKRGGRGHQRKLPIAANLDTQPTDQNEPSAELVCAEEWRIRRRLPPHLPRRPQDVYVTRRTSFRAQLERCRRHLRSFDPTSSNNDGGEVVLHAAGAAVCRAVNLALQLHAEGLGLYELAVHTDTLQLTDELEPLNRTSTSASASASASAASRARASQADADERALLAEDEVRDSGSEGDERLLLARNNSAVHIRIRARRPLQLTATGSSSASGVATSGTSTAIGATTQ